MIKEYCPDCIVELKKQSKKLGQCSVWLVCPKCGFRKRPLSSWEEEQELQEFEANKVRVNANNIDE